MKHQARSVSRKVGLGILAAERQLPHVRKMALSRVVKRMPLLGMNRPLQPQHQKERDSVIAPAMITGS